MKCLLVADLHYDLRKFDWVVGASPHVDVVVLAGDHLDLASLVERPAQVVVVEKYFRRIRDRMRLLVCSGNHDLDSQDGNGELTARWITKVGRFDVPTDGDSVLIGETLFTVCPWWDGDRAREGIAKRLSEDAARRPDEWIWVNHAPPKDSPTSWGGKRSFGDSELRSWIEEYQPDFVLSGHVHQSPFTSDGSWADKIGRTWVFNAGHQLGPLPSCVVVDTEARCAYWVSLAGGEAVALDQPADRPFAPISDPPGWLLSMARGEGRQREQNPHPVG
jgi:Icc-related predicted phosphoesterase